MADGGSSGISEKQEAHLFEIKREFCRLVDIKYRAGAREHGGNLFDLTLLTLIDHALSEAIDQVTYLTTLKHKLEKGATV